MAIGSQLRERESEGVSVVSVCMCVCGQLIVLAISVLISPIKRQIKVKY